MPLFDYKCESCGHDFEALIRGSEDPECPTCGAVSKNRLLSAPAAPVMKGGTLPLAASCPPPGAGPCNPNCCRLPH